MKEEYLLTGSLEPTNEPYANAKIAGIELCEAYNRQYGARFLSVMPTNLYGPNDNYDLQNSHVIPAFIRKFHLAKSAAHGEWEAIARDEAVYGPIPDDFAANLIAISKFNGHDILESFAIGAEGVEPNPPIKLWGTGSPRREFLYSDDLADACVLLMPGFLRGRQTQS
jgi:GDP-L-fucose synthase